MQTTTKRPQFNHKRRQFSLPLRGKTNIPNNSFFNKRLQKSNSQRSINIKYLTNNTSFQQEIRDIEKELFHFKWMKKRYQPIRSPSYELRLKKRLNQQNLRSLSTQTFKSENYLNYVRFQQFLKATLFNIRANFHIIMKTISALYFNEKTIPKVKLILRKIVRIIISFNSLNIYELQFRNIKKILREIESIDLQSSEENIKKKQWKTTVKIHSQVQIIVESLKNIEKYSAFQPRILKQTEKLIKSAKEQGIFNIELEDIKRTSRKNLKIRLLPLLNDKIHIMIKCERVNRIKQKKIYSREEKIIRNNFLERVCLLKIQNWNLQSSEMNQEKYAEKLNLKLEYNLQRTKQKCQICFQLIPFREVKTHSANCQIRKYHENEINQIDTALVKLIFKSKEQLTMIIMEKQKLKKKKVKRSKSKRSKKSIFRKIQKDSQPKLSNFASSKFGKQDSVQSRDSDRPIEVINAQIYSTKRVSNFQQEFEIENHKFQTQSIKHIVKKPQKTIKKQLSMNTQEIQPAEVREIFLSKNSTPTSVKSMKHPFERQHSMESGFYSHEDNLVKLVKKTTKEKKGNKKSLFQSMSFRSLHMSKELVDTESVVTHQDIKQLLAIQTKVWELIAKYCELSRQAKINSEFKALEEQVKYYHIFKYQIRLIESQQEMSEELNQNEQLAQSKMKQKILKLEELQTFELQFGKYMFLNPSNIESSKKLFQKYTNSNRKLKQEDYISSTSSDEIEVQDEDNIDVQAFLTLASKRMKKKRLWKISKKIRKQNSMSNATHTHSSREKKLEKKNSHNFDKRKGQKKGQKRQALLKKQKITFISSNIKYQDIQVNSQKELKRIQDKISKSQQSSEDNASLTSRSPEINIRKITRNPTRNEVYLNNLIILPIWNQFTKRKRSKSAKLYNSVEIKKAYEHCIKYQQIHYPRLKIAGLLIPDRNFHIKQAKKNLDVMSKDFKSFKKKWKDQHNTKKEKKTGTKKKLNMNMLFGLEKIPQKNPKKEKKKLEPLSWLREMEKPKVKEVKQESWLSKMKQESGQMMGKGEGQMIGKGLGTMMGKGLGTMMEKGNISKVKKPEKKLGPFRKQTLEQIQEEKNSEKRVPKLNVDWMTGLKKPEKKKKEEQLKEVPFWLQNMKKKPAKKEKVKESPKISLIKEIPKRKAIKPVNIKETEKEKDILILCPVIFDLPKKNSLKRKFSFNLGDDIKKLKDNKQSINVTVLSDSGLSEEQQDSPIMQLSKVNQNSNVLSLQKRLSEKVSYTRKNQRNTFTGPVKNNNRLFNFGADKVISHTNHAELALRRKNSKNLNLNLQFTGDPKGKGLQLHDEIQLLRSSIILKRRGKKQNKTQKMGKKKIKRKMSFLEEFGRKRGTQSKKKVSFDILYPISIHNSITSFSALSESKLKNQRKSSTKIQIFDQMFSKNRHRTLQLKKTLKQKKNISIQHQLISLEISEKSLNDIKKTQVKKQQLNQAKKNLGGFKMLQQLEIMQFDKKQNKKSHARKRFWKEYKTRTAINNVTGGSDGELYIKAEKEFDEYDAESADDLWIPIRKIEKRIQTSGITLEGKDWDNKIGITDFNLISKISEGAFGAVYLAQMKETSEYFAMKVVDYIQGFKHSKEQILGECEMFKCLSGNFIVNPLYIFTYNEFMCFVMEFMGGGDLASWLERFDFEEFIVRFYITEIILATYHLHEQNIIHRDLKPENVLLDNRGHCKLTDFGLAQFLDRQTEIKKGDETFSIAGTPDYIAPEILLGEQPTNMCDWWSIGIIIYEMIVQIPPFNAPSREQVYDNIKNAEIEWPLDIGDEEGEMSVEAQDVIKCFLEKDLTKRLGYKGGLEEIKLHPFFTKEKTHSWDNIFKYMAPFQYFCQQQTDATDLQLFDRTTNTKSKHADFISNVKQTAQVKKSGFKPELGDVSNVERVDNLANLNTNKADLMLSQREKEIMTEVKKYKKQQQEHQLHIKDQLKKLGHQSSYAEL